MSLVSWLTPWNPATMAMWPALRAVWIRPGVTSMMRALPWTASVMTPAWLPVKERASWPRLAMAMASRAIEMRSPLVSSMSSSRPGGSGVTWFARSRSSSVVSPMAETTTTYRAAGLAGLDDPAGDTLDALRVRHGGAAVLLHHQAHGDTCSLDGTDIDRLGRDSLSGVPCHLDGLRTVRWAAQGPDPPALSRHAPVGWRRSV